MKRTLRSALAMLLAVSMLSVPLVGCKKEPTDTTPPDDGGTPPSAEATPFTKTENYMPAEVFAQMKTYFEGGEAGFYPYDDRDFAPLVSLDMYTLSNCKV